jgi:hypothetical protein
MATHIETDISVQGFGYTGDDAGKRLTFPHAHTPAVEGRSGGIIYGAADCIFEGLEGRLDQLRWKAETSSIGSAYLRDDKGRIGIGVERLELPRGIMLVDADKGVEILAPHVSFSEVTISYKFAPPSDAATPAPKSGVLPALRQSGKLRFLDSLQGQINGRLEVKLDLPVLGKRTLDQELKIAIKDGSLDFRALDESLDWLEGAFLDLDMHDERLAVRWKVPIFGSKHDLISWALDKDATTLATFGRVPVRSLADFKFGEDDDDEPAKHKDDDKHQLLQSFAIKAIDIAVSLAPRIVETSSGAIMFGGDDQPGIVDLKVTGEVKNTGPGLLHGAIGSIDTTISDVRFGPVRVTADRLTFDGLDHLEVIFDGFRPVSATVKVHRVTASNLVLKIGR